MIDYLSVLAEESARFGAAVRQGDMAVQVPACPDWNLADLAWHLTEVQHFWGSIAEGLLADPDDIESLERPDESSLPDLFDDRSARLVRWLSERDEADVCWSWNAAGGYIGWVRRRQAHEALIHRVDAEQAVGLASVIDPDLASDGVGEMLESQIDGPIPEWGRLELEELRGVLESTDTGASWGMQFGRFRGTSPATGNTYDLDTLTLIDPPMAPDVAISGRAVDLDLFLWGRGGGAELTVSGDDSLKQRLRHVAAEATG